MNLILIISITIRLAAMCWSIILLWRIRDWRIGFMTAMIGLMTLRQILTLLKIKTSWAVSSTTQLVELPGLAVSISAFLFVFSLERIITERKRTKEELQKHRDENTRLAVIAKERCELQKWINTFDTFVGKFDPKGIGLFFNEAPIKAGGLTKDDVVGKHFPDTKWWSHSEIERDRIVECLKKAKAGMSSRIETNFRSADGTPIPIIFNCQPVMDDDGKVECITAEGKTIVEETRLRTKLQEAKESLEIRVKERTSELIEANERLRQEIIERKQAEEALRESEEKLQRITNSAPDAIVMMDNTGKVAYWNPAAEKMFGYSGKEILGKDMHKKLSPPRYHEKILQGFKGFKNTGKGPIVGSVLEVEALRKDGEEFPVEISASEIEVKGWWWAVAIIRDITERKQAENHIQHLRRVLKAIRNVNQLIVHEKNEKKLLQGACETLNQTRNYKLVWIGLVEKGTKDILPAAKAGFDESYLKSIKITWDDSETGKGPTGTAIKTRKPFVMRDIAVDPRYKLWREEAMKRGYASSAAIPLVYENRVFGALNVYASIPDSFNEEETDLLLEVSQDIAFALHNIEMEEKRKRAEAALHKVHEELETKVAERTKELAQANIQLKELARLKSEFLATMSHELRTPLNSIIGFTSMILQGLAGEINVEQKKQLSMVYSSGKHLLNLINDILDLSRIESSKMEILAERFQIQDVVSESFQIFFPMISQKGLRLITEIPDETPEIYSDRKKVLQILLNLVSNAVKFTETGKIRIKYKFDNDNLEVSVSDTGIGIKKENMNLLFEAFRQIDGTAQRRYEGAGLGLHLCQKLVNLLGGKIWAESEYGKGSRFTFTLPVRLRKRGTT